MHPCKKCFLYHESKDNDLCLNCDARVLACQGVYIDPPKRQPVSHHIRGVVRGKSELRFRMVMEGLGYQDERAMWHDLYWHKKLSYAKIRELIMLKIPTKLSNSMIGDRFVKLGIPRRKPGGIKSEFKTNNTSVSIARRIG